MAIHTKSIEKVVTDALRKNPADQVDLYSLIKMTPEEVAERGGKNQAFAEAVSEAQAAIAFSRNANTSKQQIITKAKQEIEEAEETAVSRRRAYVAAIRDIKARQGVLEELIRSQDFFSAENIQALLREYRFIKNNPAVDSVEIKQDGVARISIEPKPLVIKWQDNSYLLEKLGFDVRLSDLQIIWHEFSQGRSDGKVHPHISTSGTTCWGDADVLIRDAREGRDIAALVKIVTDWMTLYNDRSPYVRIERFPAAPDGSEAGWQL